MQKIDSGARGRPLRVAQVVFDLDRGGLERFVVELASSVPPAAAEMRVLVLSVTGG